MPDVILTPHLSTPCPAVHGISVRLDNLDGGGLGLAYTLTGDLAALRIPEPAAPSRQDGLWRHTCFEVFISPEGDSAYREFNFSPSGAWAAYAFRDYRDGSVLELATPPAIAYQSLDTKLELSARLPGAVMPEGSRFRLGLSAVVESSDGNLSYWALSHPPGRPDFHHTDAFVLTLACP